MGEVSATVTVTVKWSGKTFADVVVQLGQPPSLFRAQLFSLTGVEPERQKVLVKGAVLRGADSTAANWSAVTPQLRDGQVLMLMGTAGQAALKEPAHRPVFVEDMSVAEANVAAAIPAGLTNLGNTCYMNSTLQCLANIPELHQALEKVPDQIGQDPEKNVTVAMRDLFKMLRTSGQSVPPLVFLQTLRAAYPQFAQSRGGQFSQQDAEECFTNLVATLDRTTSASSPAGSASVVARHLTGLMESTLKCVEAPHETPSVTVDEFTRISCHISAAVNYLHQGLTEGMEAQLEKTSPSLQRTALYNKVSRIARLPQYLTINFVRFFWKPEEKIKAKIMRAVKYPLELDMLPFCTPALQESMKPARDILLKQQEAAAEHTKRRKQEQAKDSSISATVSKLTASDFSTMNVPTKATLMGKLDEMTLNNPAANIHGMYDLVAVLTHVGRSADSGHYMGWVRQGESDDWWKFDDDKVSAVKSDDIMKLVGGGDWHMAYLLIYKTKAIV